LIDETRLVAAALQAREQAYCPYSGFPVGAALLCADGRVFTGANVENASFGLTVCAERVAVHKAITEGAQAFRALAVACGKGTCTPCGACRQVLLEFAPSLEIVMADATGTVRLRRSLDALLPEGFGPSDLNAT